jgi:superoxide dismutase, Cu-Zn family
MRHLVSGILMVALPLLGACSQPIADDTASSEAALSSARARTAVMKNAAGATVARVLFARVSDERALVTITVGFPGIRAGFHGFHIHANDNPANGDGCVADPAQPANTHFVSADGHFNPTGQTHGNHGGDTPGVNVLSDGSALLSYTHEVSLAEITGRAVILHEGMDNFGNIPLGTAANQYTANSPDAVTLTQNTGNAGNRIACGLIQ